MMSIMNCKVENKNSINDIALSFECKNNSEFLHIAERERERDIFLNVHFLNIG